MDKRIRAALEAKASEVAVPPGAWERQQALLRGVPQGQRRRWWWPGRAVRGLTVAVTVACLFALVLIGGLSRLNGDGARVALPGKGLLPSPAVEEGGPEAGSGRPDTVATETSRTLIVTVQVLRLSASDATDMSQALPPLPGATVQVLERRLEARTDQQGRAVFTLPRGQSSGSGSDEGVYTFDVSIPETPHYTTVRKRITPDEPAVVIHYNPQRNVYLDHSVVPVANGVPEMLLHRLQGMAPEQALTMKDRWGIPGLALACVGAPADQQDEVPVLACQWGKGYNVMFDGRALFWHDGSGWKMAAYPPEAVRGVGYFQRLYQEGSDLVVVMNVARAMTRGSEQVQWLRRTSSGWRVIWLPNEQDWSPRHAVVTFAEGLRRFAVETDRYVLPEAERGPFADDSSALREHWRRDGDRYVRVSRTELPSEEGAVVHFVSALTKGDKAEAARWAASVNLVEEASRRGILRSASTGYALMREGSTAQGWGPAGPMFRLMTNNYEQQPQWLVRVGRKESRWVVTGIE